MTETGPEDSPAERKMRFLFQLRSRGVTDPRVLESMERIDRGLFVRGQFADRAYEDTPLPIPCGQTINQPSVDFGPRLVQITREIARHRDPVQSPA